MTENMSGIFSLWGNPCLNMTNLAPSRLALGGRGQRGATRGLLAATSTSVFHLRIRSKRMRVSRTPRGIVVSLSRSRRPSSSPPTVVTLENEWSDGFRVQALIDFEFCLSPRRDIDVRESIDYVTFSRLIPATSGNRPTQVALNRLSGQLFWLAAGAF